MNSTIQQGVELMSKSGVGVGKMQEWSEAFSRCADFNLLNVATGLQYLVLLEEKDRAECFDEFGFSPVIADVYTWMASKGKVSYSRLSKYWFVIVCDPVCGSDELEETLVIVPGGGKFGRESLVTATDVSMMMRVDMRVGPECMARLQLSPTVRQPIAKVLVESESQMVINCAVKEVCGFVTGHATDVDVGQVLSGGLKAADVVDDVLDDFAQAKGLYGVGFTSLSTEQTSHCLVEHVGLRDLPCWQDDGYCFLCGFAPEMSVPVHHGLGQLPYLDALIPWYALALRCNLAKPVLVTVDSEVCHFEPSSGDPVASLQAMLSMVRLFPHVRVGAKVAPYSGPDPVGCSCGVVPSGKVDPDATAATYLGKGTVVVTWLAKEITGCHVTLKERGVFDVPMHDGVLSLVTTVAMVVIPKGMQVMVADECMLDTRDVEGSVCVMCIGGVTLMSADQNDSRVIQLTVGNSDDFMRWFASYVEDSPHFMGLVSDRGCGIYAWNDSATLAPARPEVVWSGIVDEVAVALVQGGLRVGVPYGVRVNLSGHVQVLRVEFGVMRTKVKPVCYSPLVITPFQGHCGVRFSQWLHLEMTVGTQCARCAATF